MQAARVARAGVLLALVVLAAGCARREPQLMQINRNQTTPDEFGILPAKPIEMPKDLSALPPPNPLGSNRTDVNPQAEAVAAFGGNPSRVVRDGKIVADGGLVNYTTRYGVEPNVRVQAATEDLEFRRRNRGRLLERWFRVPTYYNVYERSELNQHGAQDYYRARNVPTSSAPPDPEAQ